MNLLALSNLMRVAFVNMLAYRVNYYTGILTYTVHIAVNSSILVAMQRGTEGDIGFTVNELVTFTAVGYFLRSCTFSNLDSHMASQVNDGSMVIDLLKPVDYPLMQMARGLGEAFFRLFCFSLPIILVNCGLFDVLPPQSSGWAVAFSAFLAFWIFTQITFLVGLAAVHMTSIAGLQRLKQLGLNLFMGLLIPISLFPSWLQAFLEWTPFPQVSWVPVMVYMGRFDALNATSISDILTEQLIWALLMTGVSRFAWYRTKRHITVQGG